MAHSILMIAKSCASFHKACKYVANEKQKTGSSGVLKRCMHVPSLSKVNADKIY